MHTVQDPKKQQFYGKKMNVSSNDKDVIEDYFSHI
jgi:hypothetical protein